MTQLMFRALVLRATGFLALVGCVLLAAQFWAQSRAETEVARLVASLQPTFARAVHGPVVVNIWDRSVLIPDVVLVPRGAINAAATTLASIEVRDVSRGGGLIHVGQIVIKGLQSWGGSTVVNRSTLTARFDVPAMTLDDVTFDGAASTWLSAVSAKSIRSALATATATYSPIAFHVGEYGTVEHVLDTVTIRDIRNGKIGVMTVGKIALVDSQTGANTTALAAEVHDAAVSDVDLTFIKTVLQAAFITPIAKSAIIAAESSEANRTQTILRFASSGPVTLKRDGMTMALASAEVSNIGLDRARSIVALRKLRASQPTADERATRKQEQHSADARSMLQDSVTLDHVRVRDLTVTGANGSGMKLAALQLNELRHSKLAHLSVADFSASALQGAAAAPTELAGRVNIGALGVQGLAVFDAVPLPYLLGRLASSLNERVVSPAALWPSIIRLFAAIQITDFVMLPGGQRDGLIVDQFHTAFGPIVGQTPTSGQLNARFSLPTTTPTGNNSNRTPLAWLTRNGTQRVQLRVDGTWNWQETAKILMLGPVDVAVADAGHATANLRLGNVTRLALIARPDLMPAAIQAITLGHADLTLRDLGLLGRIGDNPAIDAARWQLMARMEAQVLALSNSKRSGDTLVGTAEPAAPGLVDALDGFARFLANPGSKLAVTVTPVTPINIGSLLASGFGNNLLLLLSRQIDARVTVR